MEQSRKYNIITLVVAILLGFDLVALAYVQANRTSRVAAITSDATSTIVQEVKPQTFGKKIAAIFNTAQATPVVTIHFLDIGQGDASYIQFPDGEDMLVDCSLDARVLTKLGKWMKSSDRVIDYLVVTHPHTDHYGGCIDVMKRFTIKHIYYNGLERPHDPAWQYFWDTVQAEETDGATYTKLDHEQVLTIASSTLHFLYPDHDVGKDPIALDTGDSGHDVNNSSIVFTLRYGTLQALFTGDMEAETEARVVQKYGAQLRSDVLKVGHHGSPTASSNVLLQAVQPKISSISVGKGNTYHLPSLRIIRRLQRIGSQVWRTDEVGDITLTLDGEHVLVEREK